MHYHSASLVFPGSSIFLAWWCLCLLSLPSGCLLICLFGGFLTPSFLLLCTYETVLNDGKAETKQWISASDLATTIREFRLSGFSCQSSPASFCLECCKNRVCCLYSELKLSLANLFMWEGLANLMHFAVILSYSQSARIYSGMAKSQSLKQALKGRAGR